MIDNLEFSKETIVDKEQRGLEDFYNNDNSKLKDGIVYYEVLFRTFLLMSGDKNFEKLADKEKDLIIEKTAAKFRIAMQYAFNKGHQTTYGLLLMKQTQKFDKNFFTKPESKDYFLYNFDKMITDSVFKDNLQRNALDVLIKYMRQYFENGYQKVMDIATRFFKKGVEVAFDQIRINIVNVRYDIKGTSRMLNVPLNQSFEVTPAFRATFSLESPAYEEWDLHWDATYGFNATKSLVAKTMIHQFTMSEIKAYADVDARTYKIMNEYFNSQFSDNELVYLVRTDFLTLDTEFPRTIERNEYMAIRVALRRTIGQRLKVDGSHIFITD